MRIPQSKQDKGFTLIELLVVVVIIGILAAIAIPVFLNQREKAAEAGVKSDLKNAATLQESYFVDNPSSYATSTGALETAQNFKKTGTNVITTYGDSKGYCMTGITKTGSTKIFYYDSEAGGLAPGNTKPAGGACARLMPS